MGLKVSGYFSADTCEVESNGGLCLTFETSKDDPVFAQDLEIGCYLTRHDAIELAKDLLEHHGGGYTLVFHNDSIVMSAEEILAGEEEEDA